MGGESVFSKAGAGGGGELAKTMAQIPIPTPNVSGLGPGVVPPNPLVPPAPPPTMNVLKREQFNKWLDRMPERPAGRIFEVEGTQIYGGAINHAKPLSDGNFAVIDKVTGNSFAVSPERLKGLQDAMAEMHANYLDMHRDWFTYGQSKGWIGRDEVAKP